MSNTRYKLLSEEEEEADVDIEHLESTKKTSSSKISGKILNTFFFVCGMLSCYVVLLNTQSGQVQIRLKSSKEGFVKPVERQKFERFQDFYFTKDESQFLDCSQIVKGNKNAIENYVNNGRLSLDRSKLLQLPMDCDNLRTRIRGDVKNYSKLERPLAFVRNIFTLYEFQESMLSLDYHPDHTYCYSIDSKTVHRLVENMQQLSKCFPNIVINPVEYSFDSNGHFQDRAHFDCLKLIRNSAWYHALLLQNYDMVLKPAEQLSDLSEMLDYTSIMGLQYGFDGRYKAHADWTPAALKLFKNESGVPDEILHRPMKIRKGLNEVILSRIFVDSIFDKLNLENIIDLFDNNTMYGVDEMLIQTLYENYLGLEGQMTSNCTKSQSDNLTRATDWNFNGPNGYSKNCKSKWKRHGICIIGVEYLQGFANANKIVGNKVLDNFDFGPIICLREMFRSGQTMPIAEKALQWSPQYREMVEKRNGTYDKNTFQC